MKSLLRDHSRSKPGSHAVTAGGTVRRIYANLGKLLSGKAIAGIASLLYMIVALRVLDAREYGTLILLHTYVVTVGGIVEFSAWPAVIRYGTEAASQGSEDRLIRILRMMACVEAVCGFGAVAIAAALAPFAGSWLGWSAQVTTFAAIYSLAALATIRSTPAGFLQLMSRFDLLGIHNAISPLVRLGGALIVMGVGGGLRGFLIAWLVAALAEWAAMWLFGFFVARGKLISRKLFGPARNVFRENPGMLRFMLAANADITLADLAQRFSPLLIGGLLGPATTAIFAVAQRATTVIAQPAGILGQAAVAEFARLIAAGGRGSELRRAVIRSVLVALAAAVPLLIVVAVFGEKLAILLGGVQFRAAGGLMAWLFLARTILLVAPPASAALVALGRPGLSMTANTISSLCLLPLLGVLVARWGLFGAGLHALVTAIVAGGLLSGFLWRESRRLDRQVRS